MKISYSILVCKEHNEIDLLLNKLLFKIRSSDEIVVVVDSDNSTEEVSNVLSSYKGQFINLFIYEHPLNKNFSEQKNFAASKCTGDYIFSIDADEYIEEYLIELLPEFLEANKDVDVFWVPRINIVEGITELHIRRWGWRINEQGYVNHPDYQSRICKNDPNIKWINPVHERLDGFKTQAYLPAEDDFCLIHIKDIDRQCAQNNFYDTI